MDYKEKECEVCGAFFTPLRANTKYCPDCRKHAVQKLRKIEYQTQRNIRTYGYGRRPEPIRLWPDCSCGSKCFHYEENNGRIEAHCNACRKLIGEPFTEDRCKIIRSEGIWR